MVWAWSGASALKTVAMPEQAVLILMTAGQCWTCVGH